MSFGSPNVVSCPDILVKDTQTDRKPDYSNPPLHLCGRGLMRKVTYRTFMCALMLNHMMYFL